MLIIKLWILKQYIFIEMGTKNIVGPKSILNLLLFIDHKFFRCHQIFISYFLWKKTLMAPWQSFSISLENDCNNEVGVKLCKRRETWEWAVINKVVIATTTVSLSAEQRHFCVFVWKEESAHLRFCVNILALLIPSTHIVRTWFLKIF